MKPNNPHRWTAGGSRPTLSRTFTTGFKKDLERARQMIRDRKSAASAANGTEC